MKIIYLKLKNKIKKILLKISLLIMVVFMTSCSDEKECGYKPCDFDRSNTEFSGWTVATCHSGFNGMSISNGPVAVIFDTSKNAQAPSGDDWGTTTSTTPVGAIHPPNWTNQELGQVFGIAIDNSENIYLATSDIYYFDHLMNPVPSTSRSNSTIYKFNASSSYNTQVFVTLPSTNDPLNDIGNIAYDKLNNQLFATNLEDGKIYRITGLNGSTGTIVETYDPWAQDGTPSPTGIVSPDERVWGIGVNYENGFAKVYFPRSTTREIYSITLDSSGNFPSQGSEVTEITNITGTEIISDIAFSSNTREMLISERGNPHNARTMSYSRATSNWNFNLQYFVGHNSGLNSAGGVDFSYKNANEDVSAICDEFFWTSSNLMRGRNITGLTPGNSLNGYRFHMYGIQGINYSGNNISNNTSTTSNQVTDLFIDFDGTGFTNVKRTIGDVEVFDANECFAHLCNF